MSAPAAGKVERPAGRHRGSETARDMVLSLALLLALILGFVALLPRHHHDRVRAVDYSEQVQLLAGRAPFPVEAPARLPAGVQPNFARSSLDPAALHIGLVIDGSRFARLDEAKAPDAAFLAEAAVGPPTRETVTAGGRQYSVHRDATGGKESQPGSGEALVRQLPGGALLTLSDGGGSGRATRADLLGIAATLQPVAHQS